MVSKRSTELSDAFQKKVFELDKTRRRIDKLFIERKVFTRDVEHVYEGMFLKAVTNFESYLENLFVGLLHNKYRLPTRRKLSKLTFPDRSIATDVVYFGRSYADWMPYEKLKTRANVFYQNGEPFTILSNVEKGFLNQMMLIRNAIAHKSAYSERQFIDNVVSKTSGLPTQHRSPAGYLRFVYRTSPEQTIFENYMIELVNIANRISSHT